MVPFRWGETRGREPGSPGERVWEAGEERAGGGRGKSGRRERKEREAGVFRGWEAGDHIDKRLEKIFFNIIMLFDLHIASKYTNDTNVLAKICL